MFDLGFDFTDLRNYGKTGTLADTFSLHATHGITSLTN